jgi:hypothetical protein
MSFGQGFLQGFKTADDYLYRQGQLERQKVLDDRATTLYNQQQEEYKRQEENRKAENFLKKRQQYLIDNNMTHEEFRGSDKQMEFWQQNADDEFLQSLVKRDDANVRLKGFKKMQNHDGTSKYATVVDILDDEGNVIKANRPLTQNRSSDPKDPVIMDNAATYANYVDGKIAELGIKDNVGVARRAAEPFMDQVDGLYKPVTAPQNSTPTGLDAAGQNSAPPAPVEQTGLSAGTETATPPAEQQPTGTTAAPKTNDRLATLKKQIEDAKRYKEVLEQNKNMFTKNEFNKKRFAIYKKHSDLLVEARALELEANSGKVTGEQARGITDGIKATAESLYNGTVGTAKNVINAVGESLDKFAGNFVAGYNGGDPQAKTEVEEIKKKVETAPKPIQSAVTKAIEQTSRGPVKESISAPQQNRLAQVTQQTVDAINSGRKMKAKEVKNAIRAFATQLKHGDISVADFNEAAQAVIDSAKGEAAKWSLTMKDGLIISHSDKGDVRKVGSYTTDAQLTAAAKAQKDQNDAYFKADAHLSDIGRSLYDDDPSGYSSFMSMAHQTWNTLGVHIPQEGIRTFFTEADRRLKSAIKNESSIFSFMGIGESESEVAKRNKSFTPFVTMSALGVPEAEAQKFLQSYAIALGKDSLSEGDYKSLMSEVAALRKDNPSHTDMELAAYVIEKKKGE